MGARPKFRRLHSHTYLAMMAIKGETNRFMYFEAGSYALLNLQNKKIIRISFDKPVSSSVAHITKLIQ